MEQPDPTKPQRREYSSRILTLDGDDAVCPDPNPPIVGRPYSSMIQVLHEDE